MRLQELTAEELDLEWQMYVMRCLDRGVKPEMQYFVNWLEDDEV